jgi:hypothetical protein
MNEIEEATVNATLALMAVLTLAYIGYIVYSLFT